MELTLEVRGAMLYSWLRAKYLYKLFEILLCGRFDSSYGVAQSWTWLTQLSSSSISSSLYLYSIIYVNMDSYILFCTLYKPVLLYFIAKNAQLWTLGALSADSCVPLTFLSLWDYFCLFSEHFLTFWHYKNTQVYLVYFLLSPRNSHSAKDPCPFIEKW